MQTNANRQAEPSTRRGIVTSPRIQTLRALLLAIGLGITGLPTALAQPTLTPHNAGLVPEHYGSATWADFNNDGNPDLLITGSLADNHHATLLYRNNGDGTFASVPTGIPDLNRSAVAWGDFNNDGNLDLLISGTTDPAGIRTTLIYRKNGDGTFTDIQAGLPGLQYASLAWGDYNRDGHLDLFMAGEDASGLYLARVYRNNGDSTFTDLKANLLGVRRAAAAWGDFDNDGVLDLVVSGEIPSDPFSPLLSSRVYRNHGDGTFSLTFTLPGRRYSAVAWGDCDNDGYLDLALTGADANNTTFAAVYRNNGNGTFTARSTGLTSVALSAVAWGDVDNDGKLDLMLAGVASANTGAAVSRVLRNNGDYTFSTLASLAGAAYASGGWGDYDNDGALDLVVAGSTSLNSGSPLATIYRSEGAIPNTPPAAPEGLNVSIQCNSVTLGWNVASDAQTPSVGLTYNVRVGTTPGGSDIVSPAASASGRLRLPAMGNAQLARSLPLSNLVPGRTYFWSVQAIDTGFAGSPFATEAVFVFNPTSSPPTVVNPIADFDVYPQPAGTPIAVIDLRSVFQDAETAAADLGFTLQTNQNPRVVSAALDHATGKITLAYQSGSVGTAVFTVYAADRGGCFGQDSFSVRVKSVPAGGPVITAQPTDQVAMAGTEAALGVTVTDTQPLTYQWYRGGSNSPALAGKTQPTLLFPTVHPTNAGPYWVRVRNPLGRTVNSSLVWLNVQPTAATMTPIPLSGWNRNVVLTDKSDAFPTSFDFTSRFTWFASGVMGDRDPGLPSNRRIGSRVNTNVVFELQPYAGPNTLYMTDRGGDRIRSLSLIQPARYRRLAVLSASTHGDTRAGMKLHFSDGTSSSDFDVQSRDWFRGGEVSTNLAFTGANFASVSNGVIGYSSGFLTTPTSCLGMFEADVELVSAGFDTKELAGITFTNISGGYLGIFAISGEPVDGTPPFVVSDPANQRVFEHGTASFEARATGPAPLSYRWHKDSQPLTDDGHYSGAATSRLTVSNVTAADAGVYALIISNPAGTAASAGAFLDLFAPTPGQLVPAGQLVGGKLSFQLNGPAGLAGRLERSSDLGTWQTWRTITISADPLVVQDIAQGAVGHQFYRFVSP